jgi:diguanylate cyclase
VIADFERSNQVIGELRQHGVVVSIDDFGAGFTSLAHLSNLAVGELKLDRTFITGLGVDHERDRDRDLQLVQATIELGHTMGLRVVAEGIEDEATLRLLAELGCDLAQGYYICTPRPADEIDFDPLAGQQAPPPAAVAG